MSEYVPVPMLPLTDDERSAIDGAISAIPSSMRRKSIVFERPRFMAKELGPLAKLDELIVEILTELKKKIPEDVAEKLYDRLMMEHVEGKYSEGDGSVEIFIYRLADTMHCMVSLKEKFRGVKRTSNYGKTYATEQLKLRGVIRR